MDMDNVIPITTTEGFQYLLKFTQFPIESVPTGIDISIVDVTIELKDDLLQYNNAGTIFSISTYIADCLESNNVILYCYCSHEEILKHDSKLHISNQEYRSLLFETMFNRKAICDYLNEKIIIDDPDGNHFIHLISKKENIQVIDLISTLIIQLKDS